MSTPHNTKRDRLVDRLDTIALSLAVLFMFAFVLHGEGLIPYLPAWLIGTTLCLTLITKNLLWFSGRRR